MAQPRSALIGDTIVAAALALILALGWTVADWSALSVLRLPDTDDVMRLQQIRDWIGGQAFADLTQHRLGGGLAMHWTRLADLVPAGLIVGLTPLIGRHAAEVATVIVWPPVLFTTALLLVIRIARAIGGVDAARTAGVIAAIAYPATTIFLPGRIDHHAMQVVLLLGALLAMTGPPSRARGGCVGLTAAASLVVGLETAPLFAAIGLVALIDWIRDPADTRLGGIGIGAAGGLAIGWAVFAPDQFAYPACDGFTTTTLRAAAIAALLPLALAAIRPVLPRTPARGIAVLITVAIAGAGILDVAPGCAAPYGRVDPILRTLWLARVGEAQSILSAPVATSIGYLGLMLAGIAATLFQAALRRTRGWAMLLVVQLAALMLACTQMRGAYAGAMLAAPALAAIIAAARSRGPVPLVLAWIASAGILYPLAARSFADTADRGAPAGCDLAALETTLAGLPPGVVMAPIDLGPYLLTTTPHRLVAAPYHRNDAGNLAMYRFYAASPPAAETIARQWQVDYIVACPGDSSMRHVARPGWHPMTHVTRSGAIFVRDGLSPAPSPH